MTTRPHSHDCGCTRRDAIAKSLGCAGFMAFSLSGLGSAARALTADTLGAGAGGAVVATEKWARIEKIAEGVWAVVSTPFADPKDPQRMTLSNGGIVAGKDGVLVVEGFNEPGGAAWVAKAAEQLTGRKVTHVVVTHFHADHTGGLAAFQRGGEGPDIVATRTTRDLLLDRYAVPAKPKDGEAIPDLSSTQLRVAAPTKLITDPVRKVRIDLGGRVVSLVQRSGHTDSDVTVEVEDPRVVFCGDLVFNKLFPFYGDSKPSVWNATCDMFLKDARALYVPGHGNLATAKDLDGYRELLGLVGEAAKAAHKAGKTAEAGAAEFKIPARLGDWYKFNPRVYVFAFDAWYRELNKA